MPTWVGWGVKRKGPFDFGSSVLGVL
jgi:hypothetical protein